MLENCFSGRQDKNSSKNFAQRNNNAKLKDIPKLSTSLLSKVASLATYSFFVFCLFGRQHLDPENSFDTVFPFFTVVQFLFYVGWYKVGQDLMRPFGLDDDDIELSYILDRNLVISFAIVDLVQTESAPEFEEDVYWRHLQHSAQFPSDSDLKFGRIDLSRAAHKHPPKLHTFVQVRQEEKALMAHKFIESQRERLVDLRFLPSFRDSRITMLFAHHTA
ncbi:hypothetical protein COOONC_25437 [Cooperia oncophora]